MPQLPFHILVDSSFLDICDDPKPTLAANKNVLSLLNDFEDGKWRHSKFSEFVWDNIADAALSARERDALVDGQFTTLVAAAKNLRLTDKAPGVGEQTEGSELAEILLYGIMRRHFSALPVVPKIFYKQNTRDYAKGADSVHIVITPPDDFSLWFGEAKFYNSIDNARLPTVINSVEELLSTQKLKKENSIVTGLSDLDTLVTDEALRHKIKEALNNRASLDGIKPRLHIPILLLHECASTNSAKSLTDEYKAEIKQFHTDRASAYFRKQIDELSDRVHLYSEVRFHLILFPVPSKKAIVDGFVANVEHFQKQ